MKYEKRIRFKLMILRRYGLNIDKYKTNKMVRDIYLQKRQEMGKNRNLEKYWQILTFIGKKDIDKDRFHYIYWEIGECLFKLKRYNDASNYFKIAIDNAISSSYKKNKSKFKSQHYDYFLKNYQLAVLCFIKAGEFRQADYYFNLNMYCDGYTKLKDYYLAELYASLGAKNQAITYYDKIINEIDNIKIIKLTDYDPYVNGYLEEEYNQKVQEKEKRKEEIFEIIDSL